MDKAEVFRRLSPRSPTVTRIDRDGVRVTEYGQMWLVDVAGPIAPGSTALSALRSARADIARSAAVLEAMICALEAAEEG